MKLKDAALFAVAGMTLLTVLALATLLNDVLGAVRGLIPALALLKSLIHALASLSVLVFMYVFCKNQS